MKTLFTQLPIYPTKPPIILTYLCYRLYISYHYYLILISRINQIHFFFSFNHWLLTKYSHLYCTVKKTIILSRSVEETFGIGHRIPGRRHFSLSMSCKHTNGWLIKQYYYSLSLTNNNPHR